MSMTITEAILIVKDIKSEMEDARDHLAVEALSQVLLVLENRDNTMKDQTAMEILLKYRKQMIESLAEEGEIYQEEFSKAYDHAIGVLEGKEASE